MQPRLRSQFSLVFAIFFASLLSTTALVAQSTNRQIGTQFEVTADPLVPRPPEQPCIVPLFANYQFAHFSESTQTFEFTPPGNCAGPWEKVVLEADFSENGGVQFDRTASLYIANANLYFGTTPEPLATLTRNNRSRQLHLRLRSSLQYFERSVHGKRRPGVLSRTAWSRGP